MNEFDPFRYIRVTNAIGELLVWDARPLWLMPDRTAVDYPSGSTQMRTAAPHFLKCIDTGAENAKTSDSFTKIFKDRGQDEEWPKAEAESPGKWRVIVASTFARITHEYRAEYCGAQIGYGVHCYFEHPAECDGTPLAMSIDAAREVDGWHDRPEGALCVLHFDSLGAPGWGMQAVGMFAKLPHWSVRAPASLMMKATRPPRVSVNTHGTGPRTVTQLAYRKADIDFVFDFLRLPSYVYTRSVSARHLPSEYRREAFKQSSALSEDRASALERRTE
jgi:hypothetical protein